MEPHSQIFCSDDGTKIHCRSMGTGPGLVLVHGGLQTSKSLSKLAACLSSDFTTHVIDRRGRRPSGSAGHDFSLQKAVEDLAAVLTNTGARYVFGLSAGALIAMKAALDIPTLTKIALYEPPLAVVGGRTSPFDRVPEYEASMEAGNLAGGLVSVFKAADDPSWFNSLPRFLLEPLFRRMLRNQKASANNGDNSPSLEELIPTVQYDIVILREMAGTLEQYRSLRCQALLLGGTKSRRYLTDALNALQEVVPNVQRHEFKGLGHLAASDEGVPDRVAILLRDFFLAKASASDLDGPQTEVPQQAAAVPLSTESSRTAL